MPHDMFDGRPDTVRQVPEQPGPFVGALDPDGRRALMALGHPRSYAPGSVLFLEGDEGTGVRILRRALEEPMRRIAANAGEDGSVIVRQVQTMKRGEGYDAARQRYGNMFDFGIIDPAKVTKAAPDSSWRDANAAIPAGGGKSFSGVASFYGNESGSKTASGQRFNESAMTAAHRSLPFGTKLRVTYKGNSVVVTINDRGPFIKGRLLDLSKGAARAVGLTSAAGVGHVTAEVI